MEIVTEHFFNHKIKVSNVEEPRFDFFKKECQNKKVLHIGCADAMFYHKDYNLHASLKDCCSELHGLDPDSSALLQLSQDVPGVYYTNISEINQAYDVVLVPEVIEHVDNLKKFLDDLFSLSFKQLYITAPNIIHYVKEMKFDSEYFYEIIHPDHKYWFSPYTLYNNLKNYSDNIELFLLEKQSMIGAKITL